MTANKLKLSCYETKRVTWKYESKSVIWNCETKELYEIETKMQVEVAQIHSEKLLKWKPFKTETELEHCYKVALSAIYIYI